MIVGRVGEAAQLSARCPLTPTGATKRALVAIARRRLALDAEIRELDRAIKTVLDTIAAPLLARPGLG